jgi:2-oxoglutarate ferredoxin oxidoreductase subunit beta
LLYINEESKDLHTLMGTTDVPLNTLPEEVLCPGAEKLKDVNAGLR